MKVITNEHWPHMLYQHQSTRGLESAPNRPTSHPTYPTKNPDRNSHSKALIELFSAETVRQIHFLRKKLQTIEQKLVSKNPIWRSEILFNRLQEYGSKEAKIALLTADGLHHAKEMALVEPITPFSYWHEVASGETHGDGYNESLALLLNTFTQELSQKGLNSSRATIEALAFNTAMQQMTQFALQKNQNELEHHEALLPEKALLLTSFPDEKSAGYHGVDTKYNWSPQAKETHHSFFFVLQLGEIITDSTGKVVRFKINTTQYRAWPNAHQALKFHQDLESPIPDEVLEEAKDSLPNALFANIIELDAQKLQRVAQKVGGQAQNIEMQKVASINPPKPEEETEIDALFRQILHTQALEHTINYTKVPKVDEDAFWQMQQLYFEEFYVSAALPAFEELEILQEKLHSCTKMREKKAIFDQMQKKIDYLDTAFFYYSTVLLGWIKQNNTNPEYTKTFTEKSLWQRLKNARQKLLLAILGQKQSEEIPSPARLSSALEVTHKVNTKQSISESERQTLLSAWGFLSSVGTVSGLLQCGVIGSFTMPLSIMRKSFDAGSSLSQFSAALGGLSIPEKELLLKAIESEKYVELDLTRPDLTGKRKYNAKQVYMVPETYLGGIGCDVLADGSVVGPCIDPETGLRIRLDDPRDTLAFAMNKQEFDAYLKTLKQTIQSKTLDEISDFFDSGVFTNEQKRLADRAIKKLQQHLFKRSIGLQEFFTGDILNQDFHTTNKWLHELVLTLSFSRRPLQMLLSAIEEKIKENPDVVAQITDLQAGENLKPTSNFKQNKSVGTPQTLN